VRYFEESYKFFILDWTEQARILDTYVVYRNYLAYIHETFL